jgi:hypothetical protein
MVAPSGAEVNQEISMHSIMSNVRKGLCGLVVVAAPPLMSGCAQTAVAQTAPLFDCNSPRGGDTFVTYEVRGTGRYRARIVDSNWSNICDASLCIRGGACWEHIDHGRGASTFDFDFASGQALVLVRRQGVGGGDCQAPAETESREQEACRSPSGLDEAMYRDTGPDGRGFFVRFDFQRIR